MLEAVLQLKSKNSKQTHSACYRYGLSKRAWIKGKGGRNPSVQQGTFGMSKTHRCRDTFGRVLCHDQWSWSSCQGRRPINAGFYHRSKRSANGWWPLCYLRRWKSARVVCEERKTCPHETTPSYPMCQPWNLFDTLKAGELKSVNTIIKADVQGSVDSSASLQKIDVEGVKVTIVHSATSVH